MAGDDVNWLDDFTVSCVYIILLLLSPSLLMSLHGRDKTINSVFELGKRIRLHVNPGVQTNTTNVVRGILLTKASYLVAIFFQVDNGAAEGVQVGRGDNGNPNEPPQLNRPHVT